MRTAAENPADKKAREMERQRATAERTRSAQNNASSLTSDLRGVYGLRSASLFGMNTESPPAKKKTPNPAGLAGRRTMTIGDILPAVLG